MMYMGSKNRIAKYILPIILKDRKFNQWYVEPFVGGANIIDKVNGNRIGSDNNKYVIEALKLIRDNSLNLPKNNQEFSGDMYKYIRKNKSEFDDNIVGYVGITLSYGGKWFGGWCHSDIRDYVAQAYRNSIKQSENLKGIKFLYSDYLDLEIPNDSIIYCDPPYKKKLDIKINLIMKYFGNGVGLCQVIIKYLFQNIMLQMILNVFGQKR